MKLTGAREGSFINIQFNDDIGKGWPDLHIEGFEFDCEGSPASVGKMFIAIADHLKAVGHEMEEVKQRLIPLTKLKEFRNESGKYDFYISPEGTIKKQKD